MLYNPTRKQHTGRQFSSVTNDTVQNLKRGPGFLAAKTYTRGNLMDETMDSEFEVAGVKYSGLF